MVFDYNGKSWWENALDPGGFGGSDRPTWQTVLDPGGLATANGPFSNNDASAAYKDSARQQLNIAAGQSGMFANQAEGNYGEQTANLGQQTKYLQDLQSGKNSVAAEQLRQGLQQNVAAQRSMAAGGAPQNSAQAARIAANNTARLGYGLSGQQAVAGLQERNAATQALTNAYLQQRQQDVSAALGARANQAQGYGAVLNGPADKTWMEKNAGLVSAISAGAGLAASDRRLKTDIRDGDDEARATLEGLRARTFSYKDPKKYGEGRQLGLVAQDLEKTALRGAVLDTKDGKMVDGTKLALGLAAMLPGIDKRLAKLEDGLADDEGDAADGTVGERDPKALLIGLRTVATRKRKAA